MVKLIMCKRLEQIVTSFVGLSIPTVMVSTSSGSSIHWCTINSICDNSSRVLDASESPGAYDLLNVGKDLNMHCNSSSETSRYFCVRVLHDTIHNTKYNG